MKKIKTLSTLLFLPSFICNPEFCSLVVYIMIYSIYNQTSRDVTCILDDLIPMTVVTIRKPTCNKFVLSPKALL